MNDYDPKFPKQDEELYQFLMKCSLEKDITRWNKWRKANKHELIWLQKYNFSKAYLEGANLENVHFEGSDFGEANLRKSTLINAYFKDCYMANIDLSGATLISAHFYNTNLIKAQLISLSKDYKDWCNLTYASMIESTFDEANLSYARIYDATLNGSRFDRTILYGTSFRSSIVDMKTKFYKCKINKDTDFNMVSLDSARISPSLLTALKTNIRRKEWEKYYKECSYPKRQILRFFWWLSDYGSSSSRILFAFLLSILAFAFIYSLIELAAPNILSNIKHLESPTPLLNYLFIAIQSLCFALSTMVTLGFANININVSNLQPIWSILGLFCVSLNLLTGYFLLAVLVTRLGILFQSLAPEQEQIATTNKTELDDYKRHSNN